MANEAAHLRRLFDAVAEDYGRYSASPVAKRLEEVLVESVLRHLPASAGLVDVGSGPGDHALRLAKAGFRVTAIDLAPAMLAQVRARAAKMNLLVDTLELDIMQQDIPGGGYQGAVAMMGPVNYVRDPGPIFENVFRALAPGGYFWLGVARAGHFPSGLKDPRAFFLPRFSRGGVECQARVAGAPLTLYLWDPGRLRRHLDPWFELVDYRGVGLVPRLPGPIDDFLGQQPGFRRLGAVSFMVVRKRFS